MRSRLIRIDKIDQGLIGVLIVGESDFGCFTLELDTTFIKTGSYLCKRFHGSKWRNTFEIVISGHTAVLFHAGNTEADTRGCVLLGNTIGKLKGDRAILNSGNTFKSFLEVTNNLSEFNLFIEERF